jgi:hypothetical protein
MVSAGTAFGLKVKRTRATAIAPAAPVVHASAPAATSPQAPRGPSGACVDAALPLNELIQGLGIRFVDGRVPQHARPLAPGPFVGFGRVGGAPNDGAEWILPMGHLQPL